MEYEIAWAFGANICNDDPEMIVLLNHLCDQYGVDAINFGGALAWLKEASEKGLVDFEWNIRRIPELVRRTAKKEGLGRLLSMGSRDASEKIGGKSMDILGMNLPAYDPRGLWSMMLTYTEGPRYGCHLKSWTVAKELHLPPEKRFSIRGKARMVFELMRDRVILDSSGLCSFPSFETREISAMYSALLGKRLSVKEMRKNAAKTLRLEKEIDIRRGVGEVKIPERLVEEDIFTGGRAVRLEKDVFERMRKKFQRILWSS
ncbi:MAG: hypothetical protein DRP11_05100 [Candidatus Aenigmatarchaeota archaeon]|nr:MAG: hypothetical protein DRP11_05100 [Candidatus Aenigmarchaeota archaeon]